MPSRQPPPKVVPDELSRKMTLNLPRWQRWSKPVVTEAKGIDNIAGSDHHVLCVVYCVRDRGRPNVADNGDAPQRGAGVGVECVEVAIGTTAKDEVARGGEQPSPGLRLDGGTATGGHRSGRRLHARR